MGYGGVIYLSTTLAYRDYSCIYAVSSFESCVKLPNVSYVLVTMLESETLSANERAWPQVLHKAAAYTVSTVLPA